MRIASWSLNAATVALAGYCAAGFVDGSGPAGWINQAQAAAFGAYSARFTAVVLLFAVAALYGVGATFVAAPGSSRSPFANRLLFVPARRRAPRGRSARSLAVTGAALVAAAWAIGYGVWSWTAVAERHPAASAGGEPIVLASAFALPRGLGDDAPARPARSVRAVPADGRGPLVGGAGADAFTAFLVLCTAITVAIVLVFAIAGWQLVRGERETCTLPPRRSA